MHVFSYCFFSMEINLDFYPVPRPTSYPLSDLRNWGMYSCRGAAYKLKPILTPTSNLADV